MTGSGLLKWQGLLVMAFFACGSLFQVALFKRGDVSWREALLSHHWLWIVYFFVVAFAVEHFRRIQAHQKTENSDGG